MRTINEICTDIRSAGVVPENIDDEIIKLEKEIQNYLNEEGLQQCLNDHLSSMNKSF